MLRSVQGYQQGSASAIIRGAGERQKVTYKWNYGGTYYQKEMPIFFQTPKLYKPRTLCSFSTITIFSQLPTLNQP